MDKAEALEAEQSYFDRAWSERERGIGDLERAPELAIHKKAASDLRKIAKAAREAVDPNSPVAEGRFDTADGETVYIGKHSVSTEDADLLVINWQAPAAAPFYAATAADSCGVAVKRTFTTDRNRVLDFDDVILADLAARVRELNDQDSWQFVGDALLRDLERGRTGEMQDIVQTITAAQYDIVRAPLLRLLVVQGGPGTGKSAIALHRVSWLLYNHRDEISPSDVLVIGPNPTFSRYIKTLLPSLGDADVAQQNLTSLGPLASHRRGEDARIAKIKGDARMTGLLRKALEGRVRVPELDERAFVVATRAGNVSISGPELVDAIRSARGLPTYSEGRSHLRSWMTSTVNERSSGTVRPTAQQIDQAVERVWPSLSPAAFLRELYGSRERLFEAAGGDFTAAEASGLHRQATERVGDETWSDADVALLDEAEWLINGAGRTYAHVVVDEAQDLSPMQLRSIARRARGSLTVVGDLAQSTGAWPHSTWDVVADALADSDAVDVRELAFGYRVPRQVMELANQLLPVAAPHITPPRVVRDGPEEPQLELVDPVDQPERVAAAAMGYAARGLSVGIISPNAARAALEDELRQRRVTWRDGDAGMLGQGINLLSAKESKGLEFDAVVIMAPDLIVGEDPHGHRLLYIAMTRTTRYLTIVHSGDPLALDTTSARDSATEPTTTWDGDGLASPPVGPVRIPRVRGRGGPQKATATGPTAQSQVRDAIVAAAAREISEAIRSIVPEALWPLLVEQIRRTLDLEDDRPPTPDGGA